MMNWELDVNNLLLVVGVYFSSSGIRCKVSGAAISSVNIRDKSVTVTKPNKVPLS